MGYKETYEAWLEGAYFDEATKAELQAIKDNDKEIEDRFYKDLEFGTAGLRGVIGAGTNRMNIYTVRKATQGLANYILKVNAQDKGVAIAFDSRHMSPEFADESALCLAANGIKAYVFESLRPTPELSYAVRKLGCTAGINITASHNPPEYNGYKVYWEDGAQITPPHDTGIMDEVKKVTDYSTVKTMSLEDARAAGLYETIGAAIDDAYIAELKKLVVHQDAIDAVGKDLKIVYTPLHGTGNIPVRRVLKELGFENEEQYKKSVLNNLQIEIFSKEIEKYKTDVTINATKLEEIQKEIKGFEKVDLTAKIQEFNNKKQELENMRRQQMEYHRIFENNNRILVDLQTNSKKLDSKIKEFTMVEDLSKIANGTVYGKRRIEFEQFVQASYFDMVIIEANKRLLKMTDNRFLLVRKESSERVSDKIGLELEVIDNYNGKRRDVKSLSGGEAFKAALSLALGLSDVIQSYSGGIVVDTMFIDEGFGSLDTESREQAINTLNQLTDNHKLIGIISHVTELKERIDKKIIVTKSTGGSKITVES